MKNCGHPLDTSVMRVPVSVGDAVGVREMITLQPIMLSMRLALFGFLWAIFKIYLFFHSSILILCKIDISTCTLLKVNRCAYCIVFAFKITCYRN